MYGFSYQSLVLSTTVLNDSYSYLASYMLNNYYALYFLVTGMPNARNVCRKFSLCYKHNKQKEKGRSERRNRTLLLVMYIIVMCCYQ